MPAGLVKSDRKVADQMKSEFHRLHLAVEQHEDAVREIERDDELTKHERGKYLKAEEKRFLSAMEGPAKKIDSLWSKIKDKSFPGLDSTDNETRVSVMQLLRLSDGNLNSDMLKSTFEPIEHDALAVQMMIPVMSKLGLLDAFKGSEASATINLYNKFEENKKQADMLMSRLPGEFLAGTSSLSRAISTTMIVDFVKLMEDAYLTMENKVN